MKGILAGGKEQLNDSENEVMHGDERVGGGEYTNLGWQIGI